MSDIGRWLSLSGLEEYTDLFVENKIGLDILADLTTEDLEGLGIPLGDCKRILKAIAAIREPEHRATSEHPRGAIDKPKLTSWNAERAMRRSRRQVAGKTRRRGDALLHEQRVVGQCCSDTSAE